MQFTILGHITWKAIKHMLNFSARKVISNRKCATNQWKEACLIDPLQWYGSVWLWKFLLWSNCRKCTKLRSEQLPPNQIIPCLFVFFSSCHPLPGEEWSDQRAGESRHPDRRHGELLQRPLCQRQEAEGGWRGASDARTRLAGGKVDWRSLLSCFTGIERMKKGFS